MYEAVGSFLFNQASDPLPPIGESGNKVIEFVACLSQVYRIIVVGLSLTILSLFRHPRSPSSTV